MSAQPEQHHSPQPQPVDHQQSITQSQLAASQPAQPQLAAPQPAQPQPVGQPQPAMNAPLPTVSPYTLQDGSGLEQPRPGGHVQPKPLAVAKLDAPLATSPAFAPPAPTAAPIPSLSLPSLSTATAPVEEHPATPAPLETPSTIASPAPLEATESSVLVGDSAAAAIQATIAGEAEKATVQSADDAASARGGERQGRKHEVEYSYLKPTVWFAPGSAMVAAMFALAWSLIVVYATKFLPERLESGAALDRFDTLVLGLPLANSVIGVLLAAGASCAALAMLYTGWSRKVREPMLQFAVGIIALTAFAVTVFVKLT